nr:polysaccharide pyruvyl transferase family protein [Pseudonocardia sp. C8]
MVAGWPSFVDGEATAGDLLAMARVADAVRGPGRRVEQLLSPVLDPSAESATTADPAGCTHLVFACGPARGAQVARLHERFAGARRIAVGVSVPDPLDPAVTGFHRVLARDGTEDAAPDLCWSAPDPAPVPVVGVVLAPGQPEYGDRRRHDQVHAVLAEWLRDLDAARLELDTRVDPRDWRHPATPGQFRAVLSRLDAVVTTRLHGAVLALAAGVPALAVDPVAGGAKVTAQGRALGWPVLAGEDVAGPHGRAVLDRAWEWCRGAAGRARDLAAARDGDRLLAELRAEVGLT